MAKFQQLSETTLLESSPRIDREAGILYGVKLLGEHSKNGRRYTAEAMRKAATLYNGVKSYANHPESTKLAEDRKLADWTGVYQNAHYVEGKGIFADEVLRKSSDYFEGILEAAEKFPNAIGKSHVADGEGKLDHGTEIIESITTVFSVDWVTDPATTAGIFESKRPKRTVKSTIESLPEGPVRKRLVEMIDAGYIDGGQQMDDSPDEPADPLTQMSSLVKELITMLGETLKALAMKTDKPDPAPAPAPVVPKVDATPAVPAADPTKPAPPNMESVLRENAELKAKTQLLESGREATPIRVKALAGVTDEADRKELLESWPVAESSTEGIRPERSPALIEASKVDANEFDTPEKFAARYR